MPHRITSGVEVVTHHVSPWIWFAVSGSSTVVGGLFASTNMAETSLVSIGAFIATVSLSLGTLIAGCMKAYWDGREKSIHRDYVTLQAHAARLQAEYDAEVRDLRLQIHALLERVAPARQGTSVVSTLDRDVTK